MITFPTAVKKSSKSLGRIRADNCIQKTVRASLSSGVSSGDFTRDLDRDLLRLFRLRLFLL